MEFISLKMKEDKLWDSWALLVLHAQLWRSSFLQPLLRVISSVMQTVLGVVKTALPGNFRTVQNVRCCWGWLVIPLLSRWKNWGSEKKKHLVEFILRGTDSAPGLHHRALLFTGPFSMSGTEPGAEWQTTFSLPHYQICLWDLPCPHVWLPSGMSLYLLEAWLQPHHVLPNIQRSRGCPFLTSPHQGQEHWPCGTLTREHRAVVEFLLAGARARVVVPSLANRDFENQRDESGQSS